MKTFWSVLTSGVAVLLLAAIMVIGSPGCLNTLGLQTETEEAAPEEPADPAKESRNLVWTLMNSNCASDTLPWQLVDFALCRTMHPDYSEGSRRRHMEMLRNEGAVNFEDAELDRLVRVLSHESADIKIGLMRGLAADSEGGIRIQTIMVDQERLRLFLWGEPIPLE